MQAPLPRISWLTCTSSGETHQNTISWEWLGEVLDPSPWWRCSLSRCTSDKWSWSCWIWESFSLLVSDRYCWICLIRSFCVASSRLKLPFHKTIPVLILLPCTALHSARVGVVGCPFLWTFGALEPYLPSDTKWGKCTFVDTQQCKHKQWSLRGWGLGPTNNWVPIGSKAQLHVSATYL